MQGLWTGNNLPSCCGDIKIADIINGWKGSLERKKPPSLVLTKAGAGVKITL